MPLIPNSLCQCLTSLYGSSDGSSAYQYTAVYMQCHCVIFVESFITFWIFRFSPDLQSQPFSCPHFLCQPFPHTSLPLSCFPLPLYFLTFLLPHLLSPVILYPCPYSTPLHFTSFHFTPHHSTSLYFFLPLLYRMIGQRYTLRLRVVVWTHCLPCSNVGVTWILSTM